MNISKALRNELNTLSKELFGTTSRWQKLVDKGYDELVTEEVEETVPAEKEGEEATTRKVKMPVLLRGSRQFVRKFHTVESVREFMGVQKIQMDLIRAQIKQAQEDAKKKQEEEQAAKDVHQALSGSAK